jgi:hypothetical protein
VAGSFIANQRVCINPYDIARYWNIEKFLWPSGRLSPLQIYKDLGRTETISLGNLLNLEVGLAEYHIDIIVLW